MRTYIHTIHVYIYIYVCVCLHTYKIGYTSIQTYMHTYMEKCIHTCIHTFICTFTYLPNLLKALLLPDSQTKPAICLLPQLLIRATAEVVDALGILKLLPEKAQRLMG